MHDEQMIEWATSPDPVAYTVAERAMEERVGAIRQGLARELVWLLEHPPLYTAGTSANAKHLSNPARLPVYPTGRGGQYTYHGPGQRVAYVMLDVAHRFGGDVRAFVSSLESWLVSALGTLGLRGETRGDRVGVWVVRDANGRQVEEKIAAIGIRIRHGVSLHGVSLNISPNLEHYRGIVPCGIADHGVTSLAALGHAASMKDVDAALETAFATTFGPLVRTHPPFMGAGG